MEATTTLTGKARRRQAMEVVGLSCLARQCAVNYLSRRKGVEARGLDGAEEKLGEKLSACAIRSMNPFTQPRRAEQEGARGVKQAGVRSRLLAVESFDDLLEGILAN